MWEKFTMKRMAEQSLSRHGWLARQPKDFQRQVFAETQLQQFERGAPVYHLGDPIGGIYGVASGTLAISIAPGEDGPYLAHLGPVGYWIGEGPFITGEPRRVELIAATQCVLLHLPLQTLEPPDDVFHGIGGARTFHHGRNHGLTFHRHSFLRRAGVR